MKHQDRKGDRPRLERLEDRTNPSTLEWGGGIALYNAEGLEENNLTIASVLHPIFGFGVSFTDSALITINCAAPIDGGNAPGAPAYIWTTEVTRIEVYLYDMGDTLIANYSAPVVAQGGLDSDTLNVAFAGNAALGGCTVTGGHGDDIITGSVFKDRLEGNGNWDTINAGEGNDTVDGGVGNDNLNGQGGNDTLKGDGGNDILDGGDDNDYLDGGLDMVIDQLRGGRGADIFCHKSEDQWLDFTPGEGDTDDTV